MKAGEKLPPVLPIVVYNGENAWNAPLNVGELVAQIHPGLANYQLKQGYFLLDENRISQFLLDNAGGEAGFIFRLERAEDAESIVSIYHEFMEKVSGQKFDLLRRSIRMWLIRPMRKRHIVVSPSEVGSEEDNVMLEQKFRQWEQEFIQKGRAEGRAEGLASQKMTLLEMLSDRFGAIPAGWKEAVNRLTDPTMISRLTRAIYQVKSADDFGTLLTREITIQ